MVFLNISDESLPINVFCGVVAGIVSSAIANPTDVLKVSEIYKVLTCR